MQIIKKMLMYVSLLCWFFIVFFPLLIILIGSFLTNEEFATFNGLKIPNFTYFDNYSKAFIEGNMLQSFVVTFLIILISVLGSVFIGSMVAYVIDRFEFKGKKLLLACYFLVSAVPMVITQVSTFKLMTTLGLYNTIWAPIVLYIGADVTMIYIYLQNLEQLPKELDQAAIMDSANYFQVYRYILFPLLRPATVTVTLLKMMSIYNDFYLPYLYMPRSELSTVSTAIYRFVGPYQTQWEVICACIIISMIPMLIIYLFLQKYIYNGLTSGSLKE